MDKINSVKGMFKQKIELYGICGTIQRILKRMIHQLFCIKWEKCYLMSRTLDTVCPPPERNDIEVREIKMEDYENELWYDFFTEEKKLIYNERFKNKNAKRIVQKLHLPNSLRHLPLKIYERFWTQTQRQSRTSSSRQAYC